MSDSEYIRYLESTLQRIGKLAGCKGEVPAEIVEQHVAEASNKLKADIEQWRKAWKSHDDRITGLTAERDRLRSHAEICEARIDQLELNAALRIREAVEPREVRIAELKQAVKEAQEDLIRFSERRNSNDLSCAIMHLATALRGTK